jgi:hypothetical protein
MRQETKAAAKAISMIVINSIIGVYATFQMHATNAEKALAVAGISLLAYFANRYWIEQYYREAEK